MNKPCYSCIQEHSPTKPVLVFVSSRRQTRLTALDLISFCAADDDHDHKQFLHMPEEEIEVIAETLLDESLKNTIVFGIGIHHAGLDNNDRQVVESLFVEGKIQILVCTSTLAWGVNFPAHLVIVKGTEYYDAKQHQYVDFPVTDILQMMGRAGRPQYDDHGVACIFVHEIKKNFYKKFLHEPFPVESSLHLQLHNHINADIANGRIKNVLACVDYMSWTYFFRRLIKNPSYYGLESTDDEGIQQYLLNLINCTLQDLVKMGCINIIDRNDLVSAENEIGEGDLGNKSDIVRPTSLGKIASQYYLDYRTVGYFRDQLQLISEKLGVGEDQDDVVSIEQLLFIISNAMEFSELPVRHNEENLNLELSKNLLWKKNATFDMSSPHTKTYFLLQAHLYRVGLPISDYITDTKSVLDQVPRVLNALIDMACDKRLLEVTLRLLRLSQMVIQGLDEDAYQLQQLPHMTPRRSQILSSSANITKIKELFSLKKSTLESKLKAVLNGNKKEKIADHTNNKSFNDFMGVLCSLPCFNLEINSILQVGDKANLPKIQKEKSNELHFSVSRSHNPEMELKVSISSIVNRELSKYRRGNDNTVYSPRYHKKKKMSWFLILGCATTGEVCAMKKLGGLGQLSDKSSEMTTSVTWIFNESDVQDEETIDYIVFLVCDSVFGVEVVNYFSLKPN